MLPRLAALLLALSAPLPAAALQITFRPPPIAPSIFESQATQLQPDALEDTFQLGSLPVATTTQASKDGDLATSSWTMRDGRLDVDFLHRASGLENSLASARAELFFTLDQDVDYSFLGS